MKKISLYFILFLATVMLFAASAPAIASVTIIVGRTDGDYKTSLSNLRLISFGNRVTGDYENGNGKLEGYLNGNKLVGEWQNSGSKKKGKFEFVFNADFTAFQGRFGYNDSQPTKRWDGQKKGISSSAVDDTKPAQTELPVHIEGIEGIFRTTFKNLTFTTSGNRVTGIYENGSGKLEGILYGNKLVGEWQNSGSKKKGKFEFVFNADFTAFKGKFGYNDSRPTKKWDGQKIGTSSSAVDTAPTKTGLPVNIIGSWRSNFRGAHFSGNWKCCDTAPSMGGGSRTQA